MGCEVYCPLHTEVKQWSDRKKKITSPLFKSYIFIYLHEKDRNKVFEVPGVVRYLYWLGKPAIVREEEINIIKTWLNGEEYKEVEVSHLSAGDRLTIANGSFKGREAIISEVGKHRLKLILQSLELVVSVRVSEALEK
jgi:transcription antitermination factor NusG